MNAPSANLLVTLVAALLLGLGLMARDCDERMKVEERARLDRCAKVCDGGFLAGYPSGGSCLCVSPGAKEGP